MRFFILSFLFLNISCATIAPKDNLAQKSNIDEKTMNQREPATSKRLQNRLLKAIENENLRGITSAIEKGADPSLKDAKGHTPLGRALWDGRSTDTIIHLIENGAKVWDITPNGSSALDGAAVQKNNRHRLLTYLVQTAEMDPNFRNHSGLAPLHTLARWDGNISNARTLIDLGADPKRSAASGISHLILSGPKRLSYGFTAIDSFHQYQAHKKLNVLHFAAFSGWHELIKFLTNEIKLDPNVTDNLGWTPLHHAAWIGNLNSSEALLEAGADRSINGLLKHPIFGFNYDVGPPFTSKFSTYTKKFEHYRYTPGELLSKYKIPMHELGVYSSESKTLDVIRNYNEKLGCY